MPAKLAETGFNRAALEEIRVRFAEISCELKSLVTAENALFNNASQGEVSARYLHECRKASQANPAKFRDGLGAEQFDRLDVFPAWNCEFILSRIEMIRQVIENNPSEESPIANANLNRFVRRIRTEWLHQARRLRSIRAESG
jgi:hypothetical protein